MLVERVASHLLTASDIRNERHFQGFLKISTTQAFPQKRHLAFDVATSCVTYRRCVRAI